MIDEWVALDRTDVPSGTAVYDWVVPPEWIVESAWIADAAGKRIVDWADHSLHLVGYSEPVAARMTGRELDPHLHSLPDRPDLVPYRTSYYDRTWGFCLTHALRERIDPDATYTVQVDARLDPGGSLTYGEHVIRGSGGGDREILVSTYICHPSLANDNVAGMAVVAALGRALPPGSLRSDVRLLFTPSGVGTLAWLQQNEQRLAAVHAGLVVACAGDRGPLNYKQSRRGDAAIDRAAAHALAGREGAGIRAFVPWGTDERQFCSPGFDLPVGVLSRTPNGAYPEYHTSADDLSILGATELEESLAALVELVRIVDANDVYIRVEPHGEPQLSRHDVDGSMTRGLLDGTDEEKQALFWLLNLADGGHDLLDVCARGATSFDATLRAATALEAAGIIRRAH